MKNIMEHVVYEERKLPLVFNLNVMEDIQEVYGTLEKWGETVEGDSEPMIKDIKIGVMAMINEGIDIENEKRDIKEPFVTSKQVGRIIGEVGMQEILNCIKKLANNSTNTGEEPKNM